MKSKKCHKCNYLLQNAKTKNTPHKRLAKISTERIKHVGQASYLLTKFHCSICEVDLMYIDDKSDPIHWYCDS